MRGTTRTHFTGYFCILPRASSRGSLPSGAWGGIPRTTARLSPTTRPSASWSGFFGAGHPTRSSTSEQSFGRSLSIKSMIPSESGGDSSATSWNTTSLTTEAPRLPTTSGSHSRTSWISPTAGGSSWKYTSPGRSRGSSCGWQPSKAGGGFMTTWPLYRPYIKTRGR